MKTNELPPQAVLSAIIGACRVSARPAAPRPLRLSAVVVRAVRDIARQAQPVPHPWLRARAIDTLGAISGAGNRALLLDLLGDPDPAVQLAALHALSAADPARARREARKLLREPRRPFAVALAAARMLGPASDRALLSDLRALRRRAPRPLAGKATPSHTALDELIAGGKPGK